MDRRGNELVVDIEGGETASSPSLCSVLTTMALCRICHEEEEEGGSSMETPCACSGTLKFAHRRCVQRWCDEKGSTLCEICLQNFEPNYTVAPKKALIEVGVTIRQSVEVTRLEDYGLPSPPIIPTLFEGDHEAAGCSPATRRTATYCHAVALTLTLVLLLRHLISVVTIGAGSYAFAISTAFVLRVIGVLLLLCTLMRAAYTFEKFHAMHREQRALSLPEDAEVAYLVKRSYKRPNPSTVNSEEKPSRPSPKQLEGKRERLRSLSQISQISEF